MLPFFRKVKTTSREMEALQAGCAQQFAAIRKAEFLDGAGATQITLQVGDNVINNPINRPLIGWIVTDKNAAADIYRKSSDNRTITLTSSATVTINIWVY